MGGNQQSIYTARGVQLPPPSYKIESYEQDESIPTHCECETKESVPKQATEKGLGSEDVGKVL